MRVLRLFYGFAFPFFVPFPSYSHFLAAVCSKASTLMLLIYCLLLLPLFIFVFFFVSFIYFFFGDGIVSCLVLVLLCYTKCHF